MTALEFGGRGVDSLRIRHQDGVHEGIRFFVFGLVMGCANRLAEKKGKPKAELHSCCSCPMAASCSLKDSGDKCENEKKEAAE